MNQRIKELAEQCREEYPDTEWPDAVRYRFNEAKFAELIVKECVSLMEWQKISPKDVGAYNSALSLAQRNIKEQFGVEDESTN